jgi:uncharacterized protein
MGHTQLLVRIRILLGMLVVNAALIAQGGRPSSARPYQEPQRPFPYIEEDVQFESTYRGSRIAGTLTLPHSANKVPAVILIGGSGPQDRDGGPGGSGVSKFRHKPQLVLADHLTRNGIAVLRVDQRGVGGSTANGKSPTWEDLAHDVLAEIRYLSSRTEINPKRIGLIGRSGGGDIAAMAATKSKDIAFIVLMAAPGLPGDESWQLQGAALLRAYGQSDAVIATNRAQHQEIYEMVKAGISATRIQEQMDVFAAQQVESGLSQELRKFFTIGFTTPVRILFTTREFRLSIVSDPRAILRKVKCPVLAINGELDVQVPYREHLAAIESALRVGRNKDYSILHLPRLNHSFQTVTDGLGVESSQIDETISPVALRAVSDWIRLRTQR